MEIDRVCDRLAVKRLRARPYSEKAQLHALLGGGHLVSQFLVHRQLPDEGEKNRYIFSRCLSKGEALDVSLKYHVHQPFI